MAASKIQIYPNPVTSNQFTLQFGKITAGNYNIEMTNVTGQIVMQRDVNVQSEDQVEVVTIKSSVARGVYLIKVSGRNNEAVLSQKLVVQ
jgi:hypothetical protein